VPDGAALGAEIGGREQLSSLSVGQVPMDRLRSVFDGMFDGVWLVAGDGRTTYANGAMAGLLGSTPGEMRGRPMTDFLDQSLWADVEVFLSRQRLHAGERIELRLRREDGGDLMALVAGSPITSQDGTYVGTMLNVSDVTGKLAMDAQVIQNQRLEAIGQFAGGIAHDFNNLLTSIHGYAELARADLPDDDPIRKDLDQVLAGAERATSITRKLLAFTRRQILVPIVIDPAAVVADLIPILGPLLGDNVEIDLAISPDHGRILVDPTQLEQVIVNLAINARDAMPLGGTVTISISDVGSGDPDRPDLQLNPGLFVRISVADTGTGMDDQTLARAFDPFFTTKGPGKGTGLGLSAVSGIVAQSGGMVHVETTVGSGSTFHVDLPRVAAPALPSRPRLLETASRQSGVVLLVEDDAAVRGYVRRVLEAAGYSVLTSARAGPALRAIERWGDKIDVLVTDMVMPGLSGLELAARVSEQRPRIGVVFMSGDAEGSIGRDRELSATGEFLAKPFTKEALGRAVGRAVERGRTGFRGEHGPVRARTEHAGTSHRGTGQPPLSVVRNAAEGQGFETRARHATERPPPSGDAVARPSRRSSRGLALDHPRRIQKVTRTQ
jgi:PAS domain S-box-containing protein